MKKVKILHTEGKGNFQEGDFELSDIKDTQISRAGSIQYSGQRCFTWANSHRSVHGVSGLKRRRPPADGRADEYSVRAIG